MKNLSKFAVLAGVGACALMLAGCYEETDYVDYNPTPPVSVTNYVPPPAPVYQPSGAHYGPPPAPVYQPAPSGAHYGPPPGPVSSGAHYGPAPRAYRNSGAHYGPAPAPTPPVTVADGNESSGAHYGPAPMPSSGAHYGPAPVSDLTPAPSSGAHYGPAPTAPAPVVAPALAPITVAATEIKKEDTVKKSDLPSSTDKVPDVAKSDVIPVQKIADIKKDEPKKSEAPLNTDKAPDVATSNVIPVQKITDIKKDDTKKSESADADKIAPIAVKPAVAVAPDTK